MVDDKRIAYCLKKWIQELQECVDRGECDELEMTQWIIMTSKNEILNGEYCDDDEYNEYLITGNI